MWRRVWCYLAGAVISAYLMWAVAATAVSVTAVWDWIGGAIAAALYCAALGCCLLAWRRVSLTPPLLGGALAIGLTVCAVTEYASLPLLYTIVVIAPLRMRLAHSALVTVAVVAGFVAESLASRMPAGNAIGIGAGLGWTFLVTALANQISVTRRQTAAVARARSDQDVLAERQRLAREIHDVLAHSLSAQIVHLEGTRMLLQQGDDHAQALDRIAQASELARRGLWEAHCAVAALRGDRTPLAAQLASLAAEFRTVTGKTCTLDLADDNTAPPAHTTTSTVLRIVQEALSNVCRHAPGAEVSITLHRTGQWLELDVLDTGAPSQGPPSTMGGYGLVGMRERAELIGGQLDFGPEGTGFRVRLRVPA